MKIKFKVGDRVVAYESGERIIGVVVTAGIFGLGIREAESNSDIIYVRPQQCRRLKPRAKLPEPRRVFILFNGYEDDSVDAVRNTPAEGYVEFVEIVKSTLPVLGKQHVANAPVRKEKK